MKRDYGRKYPAMDTPFSVHLYCSSFLPVCVMPSPGGTNATITPPSQTPQNTAPPSPASQISIAQGPTFECNLFENPPHNLGIAGADLGCTDCGGLDNGSSSGIPWQNPPRPWQVQVMLPAEVSDSIQHTVQLRQFLLGNCGLLVSPAVDFKEDSGCGCINRPGRGDIT